jgi:hypothetical protein
MSDFKQKLSKNERKMSKFCAKLNKIEQKIEQKLSKN